jgi:Arrestin (or S-antigen), C-terminal domain
LPGEDIKVTIKTDNSKCKTPIRNFKFKLFRQIVYKDAQTGDNLFIETKVFAKKEPGIAANASQTKDFYLTIPLLIDEVQAQAATTPNPLKSTKLHTPEDEEEKDALKSNTPKEELTGSWLG